MSFMYRMSQNNLTDQQLSDLFSELEQCLMSEGVLQQPEICECMPACLSVSVCCNRLILHCTRLRVSVCLL